MTTEAVRSDRYDVRRIGFLADTHVETPGDIAPEAYEVLSGCDLIVHVGHIGNPELLDRLGQVAPTIAVITLLDTRQHGEALAGQYADQVTGELRVIETPWAVIGVQFNLSGHNNEAGVEPPPYESDGTSAREVMRERFGRPVDIVVHANTHMGRVQSRDGVLFVDPGSPNLPQGWRKGGLGTIATVGVVDGFLRADIVELGRLTGVAEG